MDHHVSLRDSELDEGAQLLLLLLLLSMGEQTSILLLQ